MLHLRFWNEVSCLLLLACASCTEATPQAISMDDIPAAWRRIPEALQPSVTSPDALGDAEQPSAEEAARPVAATSGVVGASSPGRKWLPGRAARRVLLEELNEAENLFFTEDGRLFVSGGEDIYELKRAASGTFTKSDHFHEDCIVEGIVRSGSYLYGVCWKLKDLSGRAFFIAGEITDNPVFRIIAELETGTIPNGMTVGPDGRIYVTYSGTGQIARLSLASAQQLGGKETWLSLPGVNGIKYVDGAMYVTLLNDALVSEFVRIPVLRDGSAGEPERLYQRALTVLDDISVFNEGFIITDFLAGTLIFWDEQRGVYAETPRQTFYGPTSLAQGCPPMFTERQLIVAEKGMFLVRDERRGDLLSMYQLPQGF